MPARTLRIGVSYLDPGRPVVVDTARLWTVLERAAREADWGRPIEPGRGRGIACCHFKEAYAAHVVDVTVEAGDVRVDRIVAAVDVGFVVNPSGLRAQVEGAAIDGVASFFHWGISYANGRVQKSNFHNYRLVRMAEAPRIDVHLVHRDDAPHGAGELPYPSVAPAIANAVYAATGKRIRKLPLSPGDLR